MEERNNSVFDRYKLRFVAGVYWLLDMEQDGPDYKAPMTLNEVGATIWEQLAQGQTQDSIAEKLCVEYEVDKETVLEDIRVFMQELKKQQIL